MKICPNHLGEPVREGKTKCQRCVNETKALRKAHRLLGLCVSHRERKSVGGTQYCQECVDAAAVKQQQFKVEVLARYCEEEIRCQCSGCRTTHVVFLQIDHIEGCGVEARKASGYAMYRWLKAAGFPSGFTVLCANCNMAKGSKGHCPMEGQDH